MVEASAKDSRLPMGTVNNEEVERKILLILRILHNSGDPLGARLIARLMEEHGVFLSERTVRYHLQLMDERGLTRLIGRHDGRVITEAGVDEISHARVKDKVGFAISRIENLAFRTTLNLDTQEGMVPVNVSFFTEETFDDAVTAMTPAFQARLFVSDRVGIARAGERMGGVFVPPGKVGLATICSVVVNGVLLKNGIPMDSKFGGILQIREGKPVRFTELIHYSGTSIDPSEIFILGKMTSVGKAVSEGKGNILANFREVPAASRGLVDKIRSRLREVGIDGIFTIGDVSEPVCQITVDLNRVGIILLGGLNPVACAHELGIDVDNRAMSTIMNFGDLCPFSEIIKKI
jgi:repressor of nif and glnA expression